jgi:hypothetical protein
MIKQKNIIGSALMLSFVLLSAPQAFAAGMKVNMISSTAVITPVVYEDGTVEMTPAFEINFSVKAIGTDVFIPPFFTDVIEGDSVMHQGRFDVYKDGTAMDATEEGTAVGFSETYDFTPEMSENDNYVVHEGTTKFFTLYVLSTDSGDVSGDYFMKIRRIEWSTTDADFHDVDADFSVKHFSDVPFQTNVVTL